MVALPRIRTVAVSYLNTKPLLYGLLRSPLGEQLEIDLAIPSECARRLSTGRADLGLVPVAVLPELREYEIVGDYCIGADGAVATVCIYGDVPLEEMTHIYLDHHSRTSVQLARILMDEYWQHDVGFLDAEEGYIDHINGSIGGLVIGDRTIGLERRFRYVYDLGAAWKDHTDLPFVFAAWVATRPLGEAFRQQFNAAMAEGLAHLPQLQLLLPPPAPGFDLTHYFTHHISYDFDAGKREALERFLASVVSRVPAGGRPV